MKSVKNSSLKKSVWKEFKKEECVIKRKWKVMLRRRHGIDEGRDKDKDKYLKVCHLYCHTDIHTAVCSVRGYHFWNMWSAKRLV
jgi:hypothetical protein